MSKSLLMMVGLPALGKSHYVDQLLNYDFKNESVFVYSTDSYIEEKARILGKTYNEIFQEYYKEAKQYMDQQLKETNSDIIIWDQTNLTKKKRQYIIDLVKPDFTEIHVFLEPKTESEKEIWRQRLKNRPGKLISNRIIIQMRESFEPPQHNDFDKSISLIYHSFY